MAWAHLMVMESLGSVLAEQGKTERRGHCSHRQTAVVQRPEALGREHLQFAKPTRKLKRWLNMHARALVGRGRQESRSEGPPGY